MVNFRRGGILLLVPALAYVLATTGCGSDKGKDVPKGNTGSRATVASSTGSSSSGVEASALEAKGTATLKGKITYEGTPPVGLDLTAKMSETKDKDYCLKGPHTDQLWMVGADKGVRYVVVWLKAP